MRLSPARSACVESASTRAATAGWSAGIRRRKYKRKIERHLLVTGSSGVQPTPGVAQPLDQQPLDEAVHVFVGAGHKVRDSRRPVRGSQSAPARYAARRPASARRPGRARAPRPGCPTTSSGNRRRSKRNEAPNSNAAASGAVSKRPDHKVSHQSAVGSRVRESSASSLSPSTSRLATADCRCRLSSGRLEGRPTILMKPTAAP